MVVKGFSSVAKCGLHRAEATCLIYLQWEMKIHLCIAIASRYEWRTTSNGVRAYYE